MLVTCNFHYECLMPLHLLNSAILTDHVIDLLERASIEDIENRINIIYQWQLPQLEEEYQLA